MLKKEVAKTGRKGRYESHVEPFLDKIPEWYEFLNEGQIAKKLGISRCSFEKYKKEHPELQEALRHGKEELVESLKATLKKKAAGYYYEEVKTIVREDGGTTMKVIEKYKKYAHPDTGAIHLLLKNLDETWRNDDKATMDIKRGQLELAREKEENKW